MGNIALSGAKAYAALSTRGAAVDTGALDPNAWYEIKEVGASSALPIEVITAVFETPDTGETPITLASGDEVYPLTITQICKTDADVSFEEGTIDVTDDCENGFVAEILDGFKKISGTLNGFSKFDDDSGTLETNTLALFQRFINLVTDDGTGTYVVTPASNEAVILFILLNKNAAVDDIQNWIILPVILSALGSGAGLKDAQKRDITWTKAQGYPSLYQRTVFAADVIS